MSTNIILLILFLLFGIVSYILKNKFIDNKNKTSDTAATSDAGGGDGDAAKKKRPLEIVIARYNESLEFLAAPPFSGETIVCYNKGDTDAKCPKKNCIRTVELPNVGKCDHTYLYHIIHNYDNLADVTCFFPASCLMNKFKKDKTVRTLQNAKRTKNTVFYGKKFEDVYRDLYGFKLDSWVTSNKENQAANSDANLKPCSIRPFGRWYNSLFGDLKIDMVDFTSIFAVSREHIRQHPKSYYEKLISYLDDDVSPECGHYMERAWVAVFSPIPKECLYENDG